MTPQNGAMRRRAEAARSSLGQASPAGPNGGPLPRQLSSFLRAYTRFLRVRAEVVVVLLLVVTALFVPVLQEQMRFETDLTKFLPDDPVIRAGRRAEGYFGAEPEPQYILVDGANVLSATALREELNITLHAGYLDGVIRTYSLAELVDEMARWRLENGSFVRVPSRGLENITDAEALEARDRVLLVMNPTLNLSALGLPMPAGMDASDLRLLVASLLPGDFRYGDTGCRETVIVAAVNGSWPGEKRKDVAVLLEQRVAALGLKEVRARMTSTSILTREVDEATLRDNIPIAFLIVLVMAVILGVSFRGVSYVLLPLGCMFMAGIWTFGTAMLLGIRLIAIDIAVIPLIVGLGVDYFVHVSTRYQEELAADPSPGRAMSAALTGLFSPMVLAVSTTIAAFMTNVFTGIQPIREFGLLCALGVGSCALLAATFYPAARLLLDRRARDPRVKTLRDVRLLSHGLALSAQTVRRHSAAVLVTVALVTAGALAGAANLRTEFGVEDFVQEDWPSMMAINELRRTFPAASMHQSVILVEGDVATPQALARLFEMQEAASDDRFTVRSTIGGQDIPKVQSAASVVRQALAADPSLGTRFSISPKGPLPDCTASKVAELYDLLAANATWGPQFSHVVHLGRQGHLPRYDAAAVRVFNFVQDTAQARQLYADLKEDAQGHGAVSGGIVETVVTLDAFRESQLSSTVVSVVFAGLFLTAVYRRPLLGSLSLLPVALSAAWVLGTMFILSISLNALTLTVTALTIGLGIDYTIYITQRYREEARQGRQGSPGEAVQRAIESTGVPVFLCALTTLAGFGVLVLSPMPITQQFGVITAATVGFSFVLGVFIFPLFLVALAGVRGGKMLIRPRH